MKLNSNLFQGNERLAACLVSDPAHVQKGDVGEHVADIQLALKLIDGAAIDPLELASRTYGSSTAAAVLAYKRARKIINPAYQTAADAIVGKMTIAALDADLVKLQKSGSTGIRCNSGGRETVGRRSVVVPPDTVPLAISARWDIFDKQRRA